jgi:hypothetical protein
MCANKFYANVTKLITNNKNMVDIIRTKFEGNRITFTKVINETMSHFIHFGSVYKSILVTFGLFYTKIGHAAATKGLTDHGKSVASPDSK